MTAISDALSGWFRRQQKPGRKDDSISGPATGATSVSTTGGGSETEPVVVWEAPNRLEAEIVKGRLVSEGIPAIITGEALGTIYGLTTGGLAKASVLVPAPLEQRALEILAADESSDTGEDSESQT